MSVKKRISGKERWKAFGFGLLILGMATQILELPDFGWNAAAAFFVGFLGLGCFQRAITGFDQI